MGVELTWLGVSTFRLQVDDVVIFLDTFVDRAPQAPQVGIASKDIERADLVLIGHSHWDHLLGAENVATNTGAKVYGSYESVRVLSNLGVGESQLQAVSGGELIAQGDNVRIRVFPSLHSCAWAKMPNSMDECLTGDGGLTLEEQKEARRQVLSARDTPPSYSPPTNIDPPRGDGGVLGFLIETRHGFIWWNDTAGYWSQFVRHLDPDVAILGAIGRGNIDGEPVQGSLSEFLVGQAELMRPKRVVFCHHDNWNPPRTFESDMSPIRKEIADRSGQKDMIADFL